MNTIAFSGEIVTQPTSKASGDYAYVRFNLEQEQYGGPNLPLKKVQVGVNLRVKKANAEGRMKVLLLGNKIGVSGKLFNGSTLPYIECSDFDLMVSGKRQAAPVVKQEEDDDAPF